MSNNIYIGNRYVPVFANPIEWDNLREYESLTIVTHNGTAYTSKKTVPAGTELSNTDYWVVTGNYNAQVELYRQETEAVKEELDNIPTQRNIILIGDSYVQGIGGNGLDIETEIESRTNWVVNSYYAGGAGYIRSNAEGKTFLSCLEASISATSNKDIITDIVLAGSVYNELGMVGQSVFSENGFYVAMKAIFDRAKEAFPKARITVIPALWVNVSYNTDYKRVARWISSSANKLGANYVPNAINWLMCYSSVNSGDNVHPNNTGYKIIGERICSVVNGCKPSIFEGVYTVTTKTNDTLTITISDDEVTFLGDITKESGQTFTSLCDLPYPCRYLSNFPLLLKRYDSLTSSNDVSALIFGGSSGGSIYLGSDSLTEGKNYLIRTTYKLVN